MFGSKARRIAALEARLNRVVEQRDYHQHRADTAQAVTSRVAKKFTDGHDLMWGENADLHQQVERWSQAAVCYAERLRRLGARYFAETRRLRSIIRDQAELLAKQQTRLEALQAVNEEHYAELADRAGANTVSLAKAA